MTRQPRAGRLLNRSFVVVLLGGTLYFLSVGMVVPVLPLFITGPLNGSKFEVGVVVGAFAVAAVIARPLAGWLGHRLGMQMLIVAGAALAGTATMLYGTTGGPLTLTGLRLLTGVGEGLFFTGITTVVADLAPEERRGEALSLLSATVFLGSGLGPLVAVPLANTVADPWTFVAAGSLAIAAAACCLFIASARRPVLTPGARPALINRKALRPGLAMSLNCMGSAGFFAYVPLYARDVHAPVQIVFVIYAVVILGIRIGGSRLPDRLGPGRCGIAATILDAVGLVIVAATGSELGLYVGTAVFAVGSALLYPALMSLTLRLGNASERPSLVGTFTTSFDVGQGLGGLVLGAVAGAVGLRASFGAAAGCELLGLVVLFGVLSRSATDIGPSDWDEVAAAVPPTPARLASARPD